MSTQPTITSFFGSRKRRAVDPCLKDAKLHKADPTIGKALVGEKPNIEPNKIVVKEGYQGFAEPVAVVTKAAEQATPRKSACDIRSYMTTKSPYRPECNVAVTPVKFLQLDSKPINEATPIKTSENSILKNSTGASHSSVKKSIRFDESVAKEPSQSSSVPEPVDTDDLIKAANDLVEKLKNKNRTLSTLASENKKPKAVTSAQLKKKLVKSAKLAELKSSLNRLGKQASELINLEKKKQELDAPKLTKFECIEVEVQKSPHKGALSSPVKSPAKPAYERFAHLIHRTSAPTATLPLPFGFQRLYELFASTDTVCSMMMNRGELITFRRLKPAVQELSRKNFTERHLGQFLAVLPNAFSVRWEKVRNFGSTSKVDQFDLVLTPVLHVKPMAENTKVDEEANIIRFADLKKMTPKMLLNRKEDFHSALLTRTMDKHEEFLASLDPPIILSRNQLIRWHPNFQLDLVPDVPPATLPDAPNMEKVSSARDVLDKAHHLLSSNDRVRNALDMAARTAAAIAETEKQKMSVPSSPTLLDNETKHMIDQKVAVHDPLKGISKSLLEKIRARQAARAVEAMRMTPSDEKELMLLTQLPDIARIVRTLFIDGQKGVFPWEAVVEKVQFSNKRKIGKGDIERILRRLVKELPEWLSVFSIKNIEYLKSNRGVTFAPLMERLEKMVAEKRRQFS